MLIGPAEQKPTSITMRGFALEGFTPQLYKPYRAGQLLDGPLNTPKGPRRNGPRRVLALGCL